jgi:hypothetical protein
MKTKVLEIIGGSLFVLSIILAPLPKYEPEVITAEWEPIPAEAPVEVTVETEEISAEEPPIMITGARHEAREFSYDEAQMLMRIAEAEAGNQGVEGMGMVMAVVLNRVKDKDFPGTIKEVIFQPRHFSSVTTGSYYKVKISPEAHEALADIEMGIPYDTSIVGFEAVYNGRSLEKWFRYAYTIGGHDFYVKKGE